MAKKEKDALMEALLLPTTTKETFFLLYSRLLEVRCGATDLQFLMDGVLSAKGRNGEEVTAYLNNLWLLVGGGQDGGREAIEKYVETFAGATLDEPVDRAQVVPAVRDDRYIRLLSGPSEVACRHLAADLWVVYMADSATSMRSLRWDQIDRMGVVREELEMMALENLRNTLPGVECYGDGPSYLLTAGADYCSSLLLIDEVWDSVGEQVEGDVVVVTPCRDVVLFTGAGSAEGLGEIRQKALEMVAGGDHSISATLLRRVEVGWKAFD